MPRVRLKSKQMTTFRILSLDGGGVRGAYSAAVLDEIEKDRRDRLADHFDLITGTSTGGIIAIGLGLGLSCQELVAFYKDRGPRIFPVTGVLGGMLGRARQLFNLKYSSEALHSALVEVFGDRKFGESKRALVITAYNASHDGPHLFKHRPGSTRHANLRAVDVAMATAAAPLYFESRQLPLGGDGEDAVFIDGGVFANCPALIGIAEATRYLGKELSDLEMLSIGTTYAAFKIRESERRAGLLQWNRRLLTMLLGAQESGTVGTARTLLDDRFLRISRSIDAAIPLDNAALLEELIEWGREDARNWLATNREKVCRRPASNLPPNRTARRRKWSQESF